MGKWIYSELTISGCCCNVVCLQFALNTLYNVHLYIWNWTFTSLVAVGWNKCNVMFYFSHHWQFITIRDFSLRTLCIDLLGEQKPSPFKEVDEFVLTLVCKDGIQGSKQEKYDLYTIFFKWKLSFSTHPQVAEGMFFTKGIISAECFVKWMSHLTQTGIRRWNYFASEQLLVYDIEKFRWCHNVKRFHKSNNIMWVSITIALHSLFDGLQQITNALYSSFW